MVDIPRREDFEPHVGVMFHFEGWHGALRLAAAEAATFAGHPADIRPPFILIFHGPRGDVLPQGFYNVTAEGGPAFAFHIMPIHSFASDRQEYQAVFA